MIFSRGRGGNGRHHRADEARTPNRADRSDAALEHDETTQSAHEADALEDINDIGPYDIDEAPDAQARIDLGSLKIPAVDGVELRVQADPNGVIGQVVLVHGNSALQLAVFAAPRSEGIWDEVRADIRDSLSNQGIAVEETDGEYGPELRARVPRPEGMAPVRFIGVDGPRWMVHGIYQGAAATDPSAEGPLATCLHGLVVERGQAAMPVREGLPLRLPRDLAEQAQSSAPQSGDAPGHQTPPEGGSANGTRPDGTARPVGHHDHGPASDHVNGAGDSVDAGDAPRRRPSPRPRRKP